MKYDRSRLNVVVALMALVAGEAFSENRSFAISAAEAEVEAATSAFFGDGAGVDDIAPRAESVQAGNTSSRKKTQGTRASHSKLKGEAHPKSRM